MLLFAEPDLASRCWFACSTYHIASYLPTYLTYCWLSLYCLPYRYGYHTDWPPVAVSTALFTLPPNVLAKILLPKSPRLAASLYMYQKREKKYKINKRKEDEL